MNERHESSICNIDWLLTSKGLLDFHVAPSEYYPMIHKLAEYWKVERYIFPEKPKWPILLVFKEIHMFWWRKVRNDNIRWFMSIRDSIDFIASEWWDGEFAHVGHFSWNSMEDFDKHLTESYYPISTEAIEEYYKDSLDICWVDLKLDELENVIEGFSKLKTASDIRKYDREVAINPRNKIWLENISKLLQKKRWVSARNIVPIFAWWEHVSDLISQARKRWFQWVITFESRHYAEAIKKLNSPK